MCHVGGPEDAGWSFHSPFAKNVETNVFAWVRTVPPARLPLGRGQGGSPPFVLTLRTGSACIVCVEILVFVSKSYDFGQIVNFFAFKYFFDRKKVLKSSDANSFISGGNGGEPKIAS